MREPLFKSIFGLIDYRIDQNPIMPRLKLSVDESISFLAMLRHVYKEGRIRYTEEGYVYRGVIIEIDELVMMDFAND